jgi:glutathione S-transferase
MMILRFSPSSPFVRKVRIAIALLGFENDLTLERADTNDPNDALQMANPLGKIPVLIAEDGAAIYDSRVILDYLDERAGGGKIVPPGGKERLEALRLQALADGILDASVLTVYEGRFRKPEMHEPKWLDRQAGKVSRALAVLEAATPPNARPQALPNVGQIALACALGYRDFRFGGGWRADHPRLVAWLEDFAAQVPAYAATKPAG